MSRLEEMNQTLKRMTADEKASWFKRSPTNGASKSPNEEESHIEEVSPSDGVMVNESERSPEIDDSVASE